VDRRRENARDPSVRKVAGDMPVPLMRGTGCNPRPGLAVLACPPFARSDYGRVARKATDSMDMIDPV